MPDKIRLTRELLKRCLNEGLVTYAGMLKSDPEAARAVEENPGTREWMGNDGKWTRDRYGDAPSGYLGLAHRLSPDTKPGPDYTDVPVVDCPRDGGVYGYMAPKEISSFQFVRPIGYAISTVGFEGYVYGGKDADGEPVVRKRLDLDYGVPTHVRFRV